MLGLLFFTLCLGQRAASVPSEARYMSISLHMLLRHDFITPLLNGTLFADKPPLMYWLNMLSVSVLGSNEFALRLPTALWALGGCVLVYYAAHRLFNNQTMARNAAIILATTPLYAIHSRMAVLDLPLSVAMGAALLGIILHLTTRKKHDIWLIWGGITAAFLIKGLIALLLPALIVGLWAWLMHVVRPTLRALWHWPALLGFVALAAPWHIAAEWANHGFLQYYFIHEHLARFSGEISNRNKPFWFFVPVLLGGFLPYSVLLPRIIALLWRGPGVPLFLAVWAAVVFVFFSLSGSKVATYILPSMMPLALLAAWQLEHATAPWLRWFKQHIARIAGGLAVLYVLADVAVAHYYSPQSIKPLAQLIAPHSTVISYGQWYNDLPLYTQQTVVMCLAGGQEMRFGLSRPNAPQVLDAAACQAVWQQQGPVYVVAPVALYKNTPTLQQLKLLSQTKYNVLLYNGG